jgi:hypothetical protein
LTKTSRTQKQVANSIEGQLLITRANHCYGQMPTDNMNQGQNLARRYRICTVLSFASISNRSTELSDNRDTVRLGSAERPAPREPTTIGLHAHAVELRIVAATACLHAVRRLLVRTTRGATDA